MNSVKPEVHEQRAHLQVSELAGRRAHEQAWKHFASAQTPEEFCGNWLVIQCHVIGGVSDGVVVLQKPGTKAFAPVAFFPENSPRDRTRLAQVGERALKEGRGVVQPREQADDPEAAGPRYQIAYPIRLDGEVCGVVGVDIEWRAESQLQEAMRDLQWGSGWLEVLFRRHADPKEGARLQLKLALDLVSRLLEHPGLKEGAAAFTTELASRLGCDRVVLGILKGRRVKVCAVSHSAQFDRRANLLRAVEGAMEEAIDQGEAVVFPPERDNRAVVAHAHEALLRESEGGSAATFPLISGGCIVAALTLERAPGYRFDVPTLDICEAVVSVAGPIIDLKRRSEESLPLHAVKSVDGLWTKLVGAGHAGLKLVIVAVAAVAAFFALATGDFRIAANSSVEGVVQRAVTAPFNGYVKEAPYRAGDTVKAGEVIGKFDDRDFILERIKLTSQREQYLKQYREAMATHDRPQGEMVSAQVAQSEAQLSLVEEQLVRSEMVAPFDGFIVSGDLSQSLGSPVERGQVLFEIAPLDGFRIALQVDERDIAHVALGQSGELTVTSIPAERFNFKVTKITPVNTAKEGRNFFRVEAQLEDSGDRLRPGMEGIGKIYVDERKLVWIWTHSLTDWLQLWVWSWMP
jgi:multidrug efflux pump subunit AcrA (membrane-fusion protein)